MGTLFHQAHSSWRESFKELRAAERNLVESMRGGSPGADVTALYEEVEQRRKRTSELFLRMERQGMTQAGPPAAFGTASHPDAAQQGMPQAHASTQGAAAKQLARAEPQPLATGGLPMLPPDRPDRPVQPDRETLVSSGERPQGD